MPDYGDYFSNYVLSDEFTLLFWGIICIILIIGRFFDFLNEHKEKQKRKKREDFINAIAESDIRTSFTMSSKE